MLTQLPQLPPACAVQKMLLARFDALPLDQQPDALAAGHLALLSAYRFVRDQTVRGRAMAERPLLLLALADSVPDRRAAVRALSSTGCAFAIVESAAALEELRRHGCERSDVLLLTALSSCQQDHSASTGSPNEDFGIAAATAVLGAAQGADAARFIRAVTSPGALRPRPITESVIMQVQ